METSKKALCEKSLCFLALVPHRDCLPALEAYRKGLFAAGFDGAYAFPAAAPLALLGRPLDVGELKTAAAAMRLLLGDRAISSPEQGLGDGWGSLRLFGPMLDLPLPALPGDAVLQRWEKPVLAPAILAPGDDPELLIEALPEAVNALSPIPPFRAAALANLALKPVPPETTGEFASFETDYSFTWELGPLHWLPRYRDRHVQAAFSRRHATTSLHSPTGGRYV